MKRSFKYRCYPSVKQEKKIGVQLFLAKTLYNYLLDESKKSYKETGKTLSKNELEKLIVKVKSEQPIYRKVHSQVLQNVSDRLSKAYKNFFRRCGEKKAGSGVKVGYPRFKSFVSSLTYPQEGVGFELLEKKVWLF